MNSKSMVRLCTLSSVLLLAFTSCSKKETPQGDSTYSTDSSHSSHATKADVKEVWSCPMHPQIRKEGPGTCSICGMNLVKTSQDSQDLDSVTNSGQSLPAGHATIRLSDEKKQLIGVKFGEVKKELLFKSIEAAGRVAFDPELYTAQSEYLESVKQLTRVQNSPLSDVKHSAERMVESAKLRLKILGLSDNQINVIRKSESTGSNLLIPKSGENLWIYAEVYEMDLPNIQPGLEAVITGSSLEGKTLAGKVISVDRVINTATRTAKVRISAPEGKARLRPESYVDVVIQSPLGIQVSVPFDAILDTGKEAWVFIAGEKGALVPRRVTIKFRAGDFVAIAEGLDGGERIVTSANFLIDSESRLKATQLAQSADSSGSKKEPPRCSSGEVWHEQMGHCMKKVGE